MGGPNFAFDRPGNTRDVFWAGDCDTGTAKLGNIILTINGNQQTPLIMDVPSHSHVTPLCYLCYLRQLI